MPMLLEVDERICVGTIDGSRLNTKDYITAKSAEIKLNQDWYINVALILAHLTDNTSSAVDILVVTKRNHDEQLASNKGLINKMRDWKSVDECLDDARKFQLLASARMYNLRCEAAKTLLYQKLQITRPASSRLKDSYLYKMQLDNIEEVSNRDKECAQIIYAMPPGYEPPAASRSNWNAFTSMFTVNKVETNANEADANLLHFFTALWQVGII